MLRQCVVTLGGRFLVHVYTERYVAGSVYVDRWLRKHHYRVFWALKQFYFNQSSICGAPLRKAGRTLV